MQPQSLEMNPISGRTVEGRTLTAHRGAWSGTAPVTYTYEWFRCKNQCHLIAGANEQTYTLTAADVGFRMYSWITGTNAYGSDGAGAFETRIVTKGAPMNVSRPAITGITAVGQTLTTSNGTWRGSATMGVVAIVWYRCTVGICAPIAGAAGDTYVLRADDKGHTIRTRVYVANSIGTSNAVSLSTALVS